MNSLALSKIEKCYLDFMGSQTSAEKSANDPFNMYTCQLGVETYFEIYWKIIDTKLASTSVIG